MDAGGSAEAGGAESLPVFRGRYAIEIDIMLGLGAPLFQEKDNQAARRPRCTLTRMPKQAIFIHPREIARCTEALLNFPAGPH